MTDKVILANITSFQNDSSAVATSSANNSALTTAMNNTLSRDGTLPNQMNSLLDMNSHAIVNLPAPVSTSSPARLLDVVSNPTIQVPPVGTSGSTVPLLNGNNTWSGTNTFGDRFLTNIRLFKAVNYTVANADKGSTLALGGSAFFTLTVGAASGYDSNFSIIILNEDTFRGKTISISGRSNFILWPGQSTILFNQNNTWQLTGIPRWNINSGLTVYVDNTNGSDNNDGLVAGTGGAFSTSAKAMTVIAQFFNVNATVTIQWANGTYTDVGFLALPYVGTGTIILSGNVISPSSVLINVVSGSVTPPVSGGNIFQFLNVGGNWIVQGFKFTSALSSFIGISGSGNTYISFNNCEFGSMAGGIHVNAFRNAIIDNTGNYTISGGAAQHLTAGDGGSIHVRIGTITITGTPNFTSYFLLSYAGGTLGTNAALFTGAATGIRYQAQVLGYLDTAGTYLTIPGNSAGAPVINTLSASGGYVT